MYCPYCLPELEEISSPTKGHPWLPTHHLPSSRGTQNQPHLLGGSSLFARPRKQPRWLQSQRCNCLQGTWGREGRAGKGGGKHARPHQPIHTSPHLPSQGGGGAAGTGFFDHIRPGFSLRGQSGEECEHLSLARFARARPPLPTPCTPRCAELYLEQGRGGRLRTALAQNRGEILPCVNSSLGTVAQSGLSSPAALQTPQGGQAELRLSAARLGCPFLSTISSYSPSQTCETPPLLSCSHPCCLVSISTCVWLAQGSPGVSTSQTVPARQEPAQTC